MFFFLCFIDVDMFYEFVHQRLYIYVCLLCSQEHIHSFILIQVQHLFRVRDLSEITHVTLHLLRTGGSLWPPSPQKQRKVTPPPVSSVNFIDRQKQIAVRQQSFAATQQRRLWSWMESETTSLSLEWSEQSNDSSEYWKQTGRNRELSLKFFDCERFYEHVSVMRSQFVNI